jgi:UDP-N-acetylmuramoyl-tripeptide--D-alanyl-D-alanine ligase
MVGNALLAVGAGVLLGIPLGECSASLAGIELTSGRLGRMVRRGVTILDDTYNANPDSMVAALETLSSLPGDGRRIAVLGRMGELGIHAGEGYERVGKAAAVAVDTLLCVGSEAGAMAEAASRAGLGDARVLPDNATAASLLSSLAREGDLVLLKASRSARMEEVLQRFN